MRAAANRQFPGGLRPKRDDVVDAVYGAALTGLGLVGFHTAFGGNAYLVVGLAGTVLGAVAGVVLARARLPLLVGAASAILGFFLAGAVVLRPEAIGGVLPTPATLLALLRGAVNGWADLLTAAPPAGRATELLVVPLLCGYAGALVAVALAVTVRRMHICVVPALMVLALSVLCGVKEPASLLLQGGVFAALAIGWMSYREGRKRRALIDTGRLRRQATGAALLAVTAVGALVLGPNLPFAESRPRFVLRDRTEPPFDPSQYPSPLIAFRRYVDDTRLSLKEKALLTLSAHDGAALAEGQRVRLAVMDEYDGVVWQVTGRGSAIGGLFERVGETVPEDGAAKRGGQVLDVTVEVKDLPVAMGTRSGVWLPMVGSLRALSFDGPRQAGLTDSFRFDTVAGSAAVPIGLAPGDRYRLTTRVTGDPPAAMLAGKRGAGFAALPIPDLPAVVAETAQKRSESATDAVQKAQKLVEWLRKGFYSDGGVGNTVAPGHSIRRLEQFLAAEQPTGDGEQFAAAMALMARSLGLPARVVMGFVVPPGAAGAAGATVDIKGKDVDAWVEIAFDGVGWVGFYPTPDKSQVPTPESLTRPQPKREEPSVQAPPPPSTVPPVKPDFDDPEEVLKAKKRNPKASDGAGGGLPAVVVLGAAVAGLPLGTALVFGGAVVGFKARRRKRRRTSGAPAQRIVGAWSELVDNARDLGGPVPLKATRMELATFLSAPGSGDIARAADAALFGPEDPTDAAAAELWRHVDAALRATAAPLSKPNRVRAAVSLTSLRAP